MGTYSKIKSYLTTNSNITTKVIEALKTKSNSSITDDEQAKILIAYIATLKDPLITAEDDLIRAINNTTIFNNPTANNVLKEYAAIDAYFKMQTFLITHKKLLERVLVDKIKKLAKDLKKADGTSLIENNKDNGDGTALKILAYIATNTNISDLNLETLNTGIDNYFTQASNTGPEIDAHINAGEKIINDELFNEIKKVINFQGSLDKINEGSHESLLSTIKLLSYTYTYSSQPSFSFDRPTLFKIIDKYLKELQGNVKDTNLQEYLAKSYAQSFYPKLFEEYKTTAFEYLNGIPQIKDANKGSRQQLDALSEEIVLALMKKDIAKDLAEELANEYLQLEMVKGLEENNRGKQLIQPILDKHLKPASAKTNEQRAKELATIKEEIASELRYQFFSEKTAAALAEKYVQELIELRKADKNLELTANLILEQAQAACIKEDPTFNKRLLQEALSFLTADRLLIFRPERNKAVKDIKNLYKGIQALAVNAAKNNTDNIKAIKESLKTAKTATLNALRSMTESPRAASFVKQLESDIHLLGTEKQFDLFFKVHQEAAIDFSAGDPELHKEHLNQTLLKIAEKASKNIHVALKDYNYQERQFKVFIKKQRADNNNTQAIVEILKNDPYQYTSANESLINFYTDKDKKPHSTPDFSFFLSVHQDAKLFVSNKHIDTQKLIVRTSGIGDVNHCAYDHKLALVIREQAGFTGDYKNASPESKEAYAQSNIELIDKFLLQERQFIRIIVTLRKQNPEADATQIKNLLKKSPYTFKSVDIDSLPGKYFDHAKYKVSDYDAVAFEKAREAHAEAQVILVEQNLDENNSYEYNHQAADNRLAEMQRKAKQAQEILPVHRDEEDDLIIAKHKKRIRREKLSLVAEYVASKNKDNSNTAAAQILNSNRIANNIKQKDIDNRLALDSDIKNKQKELSKYALWIVKCWALIIGGQTTYMLVLTSLELLALINITITLTIPLTVTCLAIIPAWYFFNGWIDRQTKWDRKTKEKTKIGAFSLMFSILMVLGFGLGLTVAPGALFLIPVAIFMMSLGAGYLVNRSLNEASLEKGWIYMLATQNKDGIKKAWQGFIDENKFTPTELAFFKATFFLNFILASLYAGLTSYVFLTATGALALMGSGGAFLVLGAAAIAIVVFLGYVTLTGNPLAGLVRFASDCIKTIYEKGLADSVSHMLHRFGEFFSKLYQEPRHYRLYTTDSGIKKWAKVALKYSIATAANILIPVLLFGALIGMIILLGKSAKSLVDIFTDATYRGLELFLAITGIATKGPLVVISSINAGEKISNAATEGMSENIKHTIIKSSTTISTAEKTVNYASAGAGNPTQNFILNAWNVSESTMVLTTPLAWIGAFGAFLQSSVLGIGTAAPTAEALAENQENKTNTRLDKMKCHKEMLAKTQQSGTATGVTSTELYSQHIKANAGKYGLNTYTFAKLRK